MNPRNQRTRRNRRGPSYNGNKSYHSHGNGNRNRSNRRRSQKYIDPSRFVKAAKYVEQIPYEPTHSFEDFEFDSTFKRNLRESGFVIPSQIQDKAIPEALKGHDVVGIANTGTGKTAAFLLPLLDKLMNTKGQRALIVAPTRELAMQIQQEARKLGRGSRLYDVLLIGGAPFGRQVNDLRRQPQILIGTPGRIKDHIERRTLELSNVNTVVLDEVDRMLDMGFVNDIREILSGVPNSKQSLFFSATMSPVIESLIKTFTNDPVTIMARTAETSDNVDQSVIRYSETAAEKLEKLHDVLIIDQTEKTLIFCETKRSTEKLSNELVSRGFKADAMHGNKSQNQRQAALRKFKDGHVEVLVATDVAARGIDVNGITHVINYDLPQTYDDYTHRIGRTGRGQNTGYAITFVAH